MSVIGSDDMKKIALYFVLILFAFVAFASCKGREWDTHDEMKALTGNWASEYVSDVLNKIFEVEDSTYKNKGREYTITTSIKDTLNMTFSWHATKVEGDSIDVHATLMQIGDSSKVIVNGYRYSDDFWAHLYTTDPGIINYEGKFRVDFFETGKTTPWAWGEITYQRDRDEYRYNPYKRCDTQVGRY